MEAFAFLLIFAALLIAGPAMGATLDYNGVPISKRSVITQFRYCYSYIIMTSSRSSGMYVTALKVL